MDGELKNLEYRCSRTAERLRSHWGYGYCAACADLSDRERGQCLLDLRAGLEFLQETLYRHRSRTRP